MDSRDRDVEINMSGIPVAGVGGAGLVVVALVTTVVFPEARWLLAAGLAGGVVLGTALVLMRQRRQSDRPSGSEPTVLFRPEAPVVDSRFVSQKPGRGDFEELVALP